MSLSEQGLGMKKRLPASHLSHLDTFDSGPISAIRYFMHQLFFLTNPYYFNTVL